MIRGKWVFRLAALGGLLLTGAVSAQEAIPLINNSGPGGPIRPIRRQQVMPQGPGMMVSQGPMNQAPVQHMPEGAVPEGYVVEGHGPVHHEFGAYCEPGHEHESEYTFYTSLEFLLWKPRRRDLDFAIIDVSNNGRATGPIEAVQYPERAGLRVGVGYRLPEEWDAVFYYTYLHSANGAALTAPAGGVLYATRTHPGLVEEVGQASTLASINYNVWDIEFTRRFHVGETFGIRPFGGLRFANINQNMTTVYNLGDATNDIVYNGLDLIAGGLRIGAEANWNLCWGLSLWGRGGGSLLYADYDNITTETNMNNAVTIAQVYDKNQQVVPVAELAMGVAWQYRNLRVSGGYEFVNWFGLNDNVDFADDIHQGKFFRRASDLSLSGLTLRAELGF